MKRIGIIGGTFNPIHLAHLYIAYEAKHQLNLDKVIFMPAGSPPHKDTKGILKASLRYDMVKMAIASYKDFEISDYEIKKQGYSYTFETLNYLSSPDNKIFFITGADCLMDIEKWREPEKILSTCNFVVFNRSGYNKELLINQKEKIEKKYKTNISFLDTIDLEISSSMVRERIKNNKRVDFFVPKEVLDFIKKNQLYEG
ncbi:nicotinate-nucleotide adenylyltransferase [Clostridium chauvoei]|uniref:Probable nicotinate-nucleotide adenylyltransferase n=2 Tax=Clostridium chauvoei TaxID=46867 RepID=S6F1W0_9CLOT|nr:nicotinate-nucleotide adenylyltransferase [Clostridium chauvoei]ATD55852.1 nicotinic acid mononucleotide adenylyltransferase [Clostridium chauvoei]ATD56476.1 nicotinate (nicotinamide) nucleotide adenylyltransferase [Clostridium chauvoei]MBX7280213.1 nicotinate-nucleotide adenylyltransferase [Clostridium chauvoei]MBX7282677.1 nicotinate-nucleotide adenylyltransferase [Clostridium chauvoei]MBX7285104.1 nicotinate-nucleotide adenylyltransferase [Clostridium chauvoei]